MEVIKDLSFNIREKEVVVLIGESGSGKSTILKMMNALISPNKGNILVKGKDINLWNKIRLRRSMGYVIQQTGLFPHMTIRENIQILGKLEGIDAEIIDERTKELMEMVNMGEEYLDRYPNQLSGGQQQRIGVARAFSLDPDIILMDEPFSALDPVTKSQLQDELMEIQEEKQKTIVFVTHDMEEAIRIADRICILDKGNIVQFDTPENILKSPKNEFVEEFVGVDRIWSAPEYIKVKDIMITEVITGSQNVSIRRALRRMNSNNVNSLIITDSHKNVKGVLTAKNAAKIEDKSRLVKDEMIKDFIYAKEDESLTDILPTVSLDNIHSIPVLENGKLKGLITQSSLMLALSVPFIDDVYLDFEEEGKVVSLDD